MRDNASAEATPQYQSIFDGLKKTTPETLLMGHRKLGETAIKLLDNIEKGQRLSNDITDTVKLPPDQLNEFCNRLYTKIGVVGFLGGIRDIEEEDIYRALDAPTKRNPAYEDRPGLYPELIIDGKLNDYICAFLKLDAIQSAQVKGHSGTNIRTAVNDSDTLGPGHAEHTPSTQPKQPQRGAYR